MSKPLNLAGQRFSKLVALSFKAVAGHLRKWDCKCDCGRLTFVATNKLTSGHTKSCGCLVAEALSQTTHGMRHTRVYSIWRDMRKRCRNPKALYFMNYGGRGIKVCPEWEDFAVFYAEMGEPPTEKHSIDRLDNDKGYYKGNCEWRTMKQQQRNRRDNHRITHQGRTMCLAEWEEVIGISQQTLSNRIRLGWTPEKALTTPLYKGRSA